MADSALSPRDIQARVRAGASVAEVADAAGVSEEHIEPFAAPVLAERAFIVGSALDCPVRRRGEPSSARSLQQIVTDRLKSHQVSFDDVTFDAWRDDDRRWHISARYVVAGEDRMAELLFDARARFSIPGNDEGRWLVGEQPALSSVPQDPDSEPTVDLNDEWAIVRAVQEGDHDESARLAAAETWDLAQPEAESELSAPIPITRTGSRRGTHSDPPDYAPAQLEQVDGVYDIVPHESEMDVLYEMLAGFNEDSVKIYAGLTQPITEDGPTPQSGEDSDIAPADPTPDEPAGAGGEASLTTVDVVSIEASFQEYEVTQEATEPTRRIRRPSSKSSTPKSDPQQASTSKASSKGAPKAKTAGKKRADETEAAPEPGTPTQSSRQRKKGRAQVPSWDEIMFGGPASNPPED